jgi:hypothetical protein
MQVELHVYQSWITRAQNVLADYDAVREVEEPPALIDVQLVDELANILDDLLHQILHDETVNLNY